MTLNRANYERLPRSSSDIHDETVNILNEEKPISCWHFVPCLRVVRRLVLRIIKPLNLLLFLLVSLAFQLIFNGSYLEQDAPQFTPNTHEKIFIVANIVNGNLIRNAWGSSLLSLVELIGPERTFVSIYGGPTAELSQLAELLECEHKIVSEELEPVDLNKLRRVLLPDGNERIKRISFLAEVRNKALQPLAELEARGRKFDKVLFINDVFFNPSEAIRLIWGTNLNEHGNAEYKAACAADFVKSWKYYDTFATRDAEGYSLGLPIYPWFSSKGEATSRKDVLANRDAVRVKSCWGGMVSFDARYFRAASIRTSKTATNTTQDIETISPVRFRSESEAFWDASECCLVHADIMALPYFYSLSADPEKFNTGIFMNPFVRTAYSADAFAWISVAKRFERMMVPIHWLISQLAKVPRYNYRRMEYPGQIIEDRVWVNYNFTQNATKNEGKHRNAKYWHVSARRTSSLSIKSWSQRGYYKRVQRVATNGGFCGTRQLMVLKEKDFPNENNGKGGENWDNLLWNIPPLYL